MKGTKNSNLLPTQEENTASLKDHAPAEGGDGPGSSDGGSAGSSSITTGGHNPDGSSPPRINIY
ncbi:hypothetical protein ACP26L_16670 [Paenibacillus sp. S-38]|uniref:hypothetical protein n=1 Tax=Paenibacillus sp. S-38 TaxID=3416710 RepID=UPI003CEB8321